ncbi:MAG: bifunctional 2-C-methyl-D-erythritol 4-phosphate cytidylyltransferase/2-C-methyl-D-erythritol 2,4-cyclodiphosphate synthase [Caulobacteraceae bacterium]
MKFVGIIVAAGKGLRAGGELPKQWRPLLGKPVVRWSAEALQASGAAALIIVIAPGDRDRVEAILGNMSNLTIVEGGAERVDSVRAGLEAARAFDPQAVLIHDAARPFLNQGHVDALLAALIGHDGALPALPVSDTLKAAQGVEVLRTVDRAGLWRAQTPQAFRFDALMAAYAAWPADETPTDDCSVMERAGGRVAITPGDPLLMKLTYAEDFIMAEQLGGAARITRVGQGVDSHRFGEGDHVWLCGVKIPHTHCLIGHSDADAGLHALTDAILGAIGEGDIGDHFPPTDPKWKGAASDAFLIHVLDLVKAKGGLLINVDVTLICESPKVKPHRLAMRERLAELTGLPLDRISVKATTMEEMGFTGRREGLASQAIVAIETPA